MQRYAAAVVEGQYCINGRRQSVREGRQEAVGRGTEKAAVGGGLEGAWREWERAERRWRAVCGGCRRAHVGTARAYNPAGEGLQPWD